MELGLSFCIEFSTLNFWFLKMLATAHLITLKHLTYALFFQSLAGLQSYHQLRPAKDRCSRLDAHRRRKYLEQFSNHSFQPIYLKFAGHWQFCQVLWRRNWFERQEGGFWPGCSMGNILSRIPLTCCRLSSAAHSKIHPHIWGWSWSLISWSRSFSKRLID